MQITLIAATDQQNGIGKNGTLPWHVPEDMSHFLRTTKGHTVVMGRKTFESLRTPLKGRENWVLSRTMEGTNGLFISPRSVNMGFRISTSIEPILDLQGEIYIIGGAEIYKAFMPYATELILTRINGNYDCDVFFPDIMAGFKLVGHTDLSEQAKVCYYEKR